MPEASAWSTTVSVNVKGTTAPGGGFERISRPIPARTTSTSGRATFGEIAKLAEPSSTASKSATLALGPSSRTRRRVTQLVAVVSRRDDPLGTYRAAKSRQ